MRSYMTQLCREVAYLEPPVSPWGHCGVSFKITVHIGQKTPTHKYRVKLCAYAQGYWISVIYSLVKERWVEEL
jgi:hypothetical protein